MPLVASRPTRPAAPRQQRVETVGRPVDDLGGPAQQVGDLESAFLGGCRQGIEDALDRIGRVVVGALAVAIGRPASRTTQSTNVPPMSMPMRMATALLSLVYAANDIVHTRRRGYAIPMARRRSAQTGYDPRASRAGRLGHAAANRDRPGRRHRSPAAAVLEDVLPPGARLLQEDLAAVFQTSRIPVREALRMLEYEGLVRSEPHRGFTVTGRIPTRSRKIFELRTLLETYAIRQATPLLTERDLADLRYASRAWSPRQTRVRRECAWRSSDLRLYATTARPRLVSLIARLRQEVLRSLTWWDVEPSPQHHGRFLEAVESRDTERPWTS